MHLTITTIIIHINTITIQTIAKQQQITITLVDQVQVIAQQAIMFV